MLVQAERACKLIIFIVIMFETKISFKIINTIK